MREMTQAVVSNARDTRGNRPSYLAKAEPCRYCGRRIVLALCRDGRWRTFDPTRVPPAPSGVWAWRKTWGMEEQDQFPGYRLHFCAEYGDSHGGPASIGELVGGRYVP